MYGSFETLLRGLYVRTIRKRFSPLNLQRLKLLYFGWDYRKLFSLPSMSFTDQLRLVRDFLMIDWHVPAGCVPREVVAIAMGVAEVRGAKGEYLVECGVFSGNLTCKLSLLGGRLGYRVAAFDSFRGVPVNDEAKRYDTFDFGGTYAVSEEQVRRNVETFGDPHVVEYFAGWFSESMAKLPISRWRIAIIDCDQLIGTRDALDGLLQARQEGQVVYSQDYHIKHIREFLNDSGFWEVRGLPPPKFTYQCGALARALLTTND